MIDQLPIDTGGAPVLETADNAWKWVATAAVTLFTTLLGVAYKNRSSTQGLEDVDTLRSLDGTCR